MKLNSIKKSDRIKKLVEYLYKKLGESKFLIKDFRASNIYSIGLTDSSEKYLIYITTAGLKSGCYNVSLEKLSEVNEGLYESTGDNYKNISLDMLERIMIDHLKIKK